MNATADVPPAKAWRITPEDALPFPLTLTWRVLLREPSAEPAVISANDGLGGCFLRFSRLADVYGSPHHIRILPRGFITLDALHHVLLDQVLPLSLAASGEIVLHAAAVARHDSTIVICGPAGAGKSTLAAALSTLGFAMLADDGVLVKQAETVRAIGSYPDLRLWPGSASTFGFVRTRPVPDSPGKVRIEDVPVVAATPRTIDRLYILARGPAFACDALHGQAALAALLTNAFRSDLGDRAALARQLSDLQRLATRLSVWRLTIPDDLSAIVDAARTLAAHAGSTPAG